MVGTGWSSCRSTVGCMHAVVFVLSQLWRTQTELQTEADEGCPWKKLEVQTEINDVQVLIQTERTGASAPLRVKRRTKM